jgi:hypothetical protein
MIAPLRWQDYLLAAIACHRLADQLRAVNATSAAQIETDTAKAALMRAVTSARQLVMRDRGDSIGDAGSMGFAIALETSLAFSFRCAQIDGNLAVAERAVREALA